MELCCTCVSAGSQELRGQFLSTQTHDYLGTAVLDICMQCRYPLRNHPHHEVSGSLLIETDPDLEGEQVSLSPSAAGSLRCCMRLAHLTVPAASATPVETPGQCLQPLLMQCCCCTARHVAWKKCISMCVRYANTVRTLFPNCCHGCKLFRPSLKHGLVLADEAGSRARKTARRRTTRTMAELTETE